MADPVTLFAINAAVSLAVSAIVSALTPKQKIEGPRLNDLKAQSSTYGGFIPKIYGTMRIAGTVGWIEDNQIKETKHTEDIGGKGGPGAESTTYTYSASFAVMFSQGEISAIRRIWADSILIVDFSTAATVGGFVESGNSYTSLTVYKGESDQIVDDVIQANQPDTPAYRNTAYINLENFQLERFGNRLPNITAEIVTSHNETYVLAEAFDRLPDPGVLDGAGQVPRLEHSILEDGVIRILRSWFAFSLSFNVKLYKLDYFGNLISEKNALFTSKSTGSPFAQMQVTGQVRGMDAFFGTINTASAAESDSYWFYPITSESEYWSEQLGHRDVDGSPFSSTGFNRLRIAVANETHVYATKTDADHSLDSAVILRFPRLSDTRIDINADAEVTGLGGGGVKDIYLHGGYLYSLNSATIYQLDLDLNILNTWSGLTSVPDSPGFTTDGKRFVLAAGTHGATDDATASVYELEPDNTISLVSSFTIPWLATDDINRPIAISENLLIGHETFVSNGLFTTGEETLSIVASDICADAGLESGDIDVTALTDQVKGYAITSLSSAASALEPLQIAYQFDAIESDYKLKFVKRGGSSVVTLTEDDLAAHEFGQSRPEEITQKRAKEAGLPSEVSIKYIDQDRNYDTSEQYAQRSISKSEHKASIDLALVQSADEAAQLAEIGLYNAWTERNTYSFTLPYKYAYLEATDIVTILYESINYKLRITEVTFGRPGIIEVRAVADRADLYTSNAVGFSGQSVSTGIRFKGPTNIKVLDIPILRDRDDDSGFYIAAGGYYPGWSGCVLMKSVDGGASYVQSRSIINESTMGSSTDTLADADTTVTDRTNTVNINVYNSKTLSSVTELAMLNGSNVAALGAYGRWELIKFQTATLESDGTYTLSNLVRGYRGTEHNTGNHIADDEFVLLTTNMIRTSSNDDEIGSERHYKGVTTGKNINTAREIAFTNTAQGLEPYAPTHITGSIDGSNNWDIYWIRRTRKGGELRDYVDASLGEDSESYEVDIMDGATVKRTLTSSTEYVEYSSADQVTDWGSNQTTIEINAYQLSAITGRGQVANITIVG